MPVIFQHYAEPYLAVYPQYPAAYASLENLVSVGALACHSDDRTSFSNYSNRIVDLFTTGEFVRIYYNNCFHEIHGTSFSTSIVAGQAAIHFAENANKSAENVLCLLRSQSRPFPGDQLAIFGIVDVSRDGSVCRKEDKVKSSGDANQLERRTTSGLATSPNPFYDQLDLKLEKVDGPTKVSLLDGRGREMLTREVMQQRLQLNLGHLPTGVYWLSVQNSEGRQTRTVVKK
ncbi:MAG: S8 family peptidase [Lewinella sp.]